MWYIKKPIPIQAIEWTGENFDEIHNFIIGQPVVITMSNDLIISTLEGEMRAPVGSWIIQGVGGEYYPCRGDIFQQTYEPLPEKEN